MNKLTQYLASTLFLLCLSFSGHAHLMASQKGTLNFDEQGGYLVLSLPASAFLEFDLNNNQRLSLPEVKAQQKAIINKVRQSIFLDVNKQIIKLSGTLLAPQKSHLKNQHFIDQIVVIGKFLIPLEAETYTHMSLFGQVPEQQIITLTVTKKCHPKRLLLDFIPNEPIQLIPSI